jgi:hypothetical protein
MTQELVSIKSDTLLIPFFDTTSMGSDIIGNINAVFSSWYPNFIKDEKYKDVKLLDLNMGGGNRMWGTERWLNVPTICLDLPSSADNVIIDKNVLFILFVDETNTSYHGNSLSSPMSAETNTFTTDYIKFESDVVKFKSFNALVYPIVRNVGECKEFLQHTIAAIEGADMSDSALSNLLPNPFFTPDEVILMKGNLKNNTYKKTGRKTLKDYGWNYIENRASSYTANHSSSNSVGYGANVLTEEIFTKDIANFLKSSEKLVETTKEVKYLEKEYLYVEGQTYTDIKELNNSFTLSFSLRTSKWVSWHSYLPTNYITTPERLYTLTRGNNIIWEHNKKGLYQEFYGLLKPFVVEYKSTETNITKKNYEEVNINLQTDKYLKETKEFVSTNDFFTNLIVYNSNQCTGDLSIIVNKQEDNNYMGYEIKNLNLNEIEAKKKEKVWSINDIRDYRVDYSKSIFDSSLSSRQDDYYTDKVLNSSSINFSKNWSELEPLKDKFATFRFTNKNVKDIKYTLLNTIETEIKSER